MTNPTKIKLQSPSELLIDWDDGTQRRYRVQQLRDECPCATCRELRSQPPAATGLLPILSPGEAKPLTLVDMKPVGHYAYGLVFSDGHQTGIYTIERLRELGEEVSPA